jgi:hypothetical protein
MKYTCQFCKKDFVRETSLTVHSCEPRRRRQERSERGVELGFQAYIKFYEMTQGSAKLKTYDDFCDSPYYKAFVKFGRYCVSIRAINPARFMEWVLKQTKKIDHWCSDTVYTEYLTFYLRVENVNDALARAIEFGLDWSEKTGNPPHDCLRYGGTNSLMYAVSSGRISPWIIFNSESGQIFLDSLTPEQIAIIYPYIDVDHWQKRFQDYPADQEYAKEILKQAGW